MQQFFCHQNAQLLIQLLALKKVLLELKVAIFATNMNHFHLGFDFAEKGALLFVALDCFDLLHNQSHCFTIECELFVLKAPSQLVFF